MGTDHNPWLYANMSLRERRARENPGGSVIDIKFHRRQNTKANLRLRFNPRLVPLPVFDSVKIKKNEDARLFEEWRKIIKERIEANAPGMNPKRLEFYPDQRSTGVIYGSPLDKTPTLNLVSDMSVTSPRQHTSPMKGGLISKKSLRRKLNRPPAEDREDGVKEIRQAKPGLDTIMGDFGLAEDWDVELLDRHLAEIDDQIQVLRDEISLLQTEIRLVTSTVTNEPSLLVASVQDKATLRQELMSKEKESQREREVLLFAMNRTDMCDE